MRLEQFIDWFTVFSNMGLPRSRRYRAVQNEENIARVRKSIDDRFHYRQRSLQLTTSRLYSLQNILRQLYLFHILLVHELKRNDPQIRLEDVRRFHG